MSTAAEMIILLASLAAMSASWAGALGAVRHLARPRNTERNQTGFTAVNKGPRAFDELSFLFDEDHCATLSVKALAAYLAKCKELAC